MPGTRLAFNEAHGVNIPKRKEVTQPNISLKQRLDTAWLHHANAGVICISVRRQYAPEPSLLHSFSSLSGTSEQKEGLLWSFCFRTAKTQLHWLTLIKLIFFGELVPLALDSLNEPSSRWPASTSAALLNLRVCLSAVFEHTGPFFVNSTLPATGLLHFFIRRPSTQASLGESWGNCRELVLH